MNSLVAPVTEGSPTWRERENSNSLVKVGKNPKLIAAKPLTSPSNRDVDITEKLLLMPLGNSTGRPSDNAGRMGVVPLQLRRTRSMPVVTIRLEPSGLVKTIWVPSKLLAIVPVFPQRKRRTSTPAPPLTMSNSPARCPPQSLCGAKMSSPSPPSSESFPSPPKIRSGPASPLIVSAPAPPSSLSASAPPNSRSPLPLPTKVSESAPPSMIAAPDRAVRESAPAPRTMPDPMPGEAAAWTSTNALCPPCRT